MSCDNGEIEFQWKQPESARAYLAWLKTQAS